MNDIKRLHGQDSLFKSVLGRKEVMIDFLKKRVPPAILNTINLATLKRENCSFVDRQLNSRHSDLIFSVNMEGKVGYLYILLEHQSREDPMQAYRILEYNLQLIKQHIDSGNHKKFPCILNLVVYTGKKPYKGPHSLEEAFENPVSLRMLFSQPFLIDLQREEGLTPGQKEELLERLLKEAHNRDILTLLKDVNFTKLIKVSSYSSEAMIFILSKAPDNTNIKRVVELVGLEQTKQDNIMSALQAIEAKGIQKGRAEGRTEGRAEGRTEGRTEGRAEGRTEGRTEGRAEQIKEFLTQGLLTKPQADQLLRLLRQK